MHFLQNGMQPSTPACRIPEGQELVAPGQRWSAGQQDVLDVVELKHGAVLYGSLHLVEHFR